VKHPKDTHYNAKYTPLNTKIPYLKQLFKDKPHIIFLKERAREPEKKKERKKADTKRGAPPTEHRREKHGGAHDGGAFILLNKKPEGAKAPKGRG